MTLQSPRAAGLIVALGSLGLLGGALLFQYVGGLLPCALCLWQRYPLAVLIGLGALIVSVGDEPAARRTQQRLLALAVLLFAADSGIAVFHVGVEQTWAVKRSRDLIARADEEAHPRRD